ncbi:hypothetical protein EK0264_01435 [Epidermidibacterium keratini]|uniref:Uncharacterized protein n=1 Tax=Epidermidibacterium keratini TaxID=1891644 RepID=A0A7L4YHU0_9ACTN|nr:hypothetical protein [Epidermidibacterium keratini]QHB99084.1 hypothetical protein EK0264_01435 [Epidermidibacterium keratini]
MVSDDAPATAGVPGGDAGTPDDAAPSTQRWSRPATWSMPQRLAALGVLVALIAGVVLVVHLSRDDEPTPQTGDIIADAYPFSYDDEQVEREIKLPSGSLYLRFTDPVPSAPPSEDQQADPLSVEGHALLPFEWQYANLYRFQAAAAQATITLAVGDARYELGNVLPLGPRSPAQSGYLVLPGAADSLSLEDVTIEVLFDGQLQTVNAGTGEGDFGSAQALYDRPATNTSFTPGGCAADPASTPIDGQLVTVTDCLLDSISVEPYVDGLGWVSAGTTWVTVNWTMRVDVRLANDAEDSLSVYTLSSAALEPTLDGIAPAKVDQSLDTSRTLKLTATYPVTELVGVHQLATSGTISGELRYPDSPEVQGLPAALTASWSAPMSFEVTA